MAAQVNGEAMFSKPSSKNKMSRPLRMSTKADKNERCGEVEIWEDEDQVVKFQEIIDLLLAAGYFRARIKGLSAFDKIVGGFTWCLEVCNFDVDVDLLFQESLTIGQKIALTEKIVAVLTQMKCPHRLEPHQIQGLDCINIYPVVQWLVKHAIEVREEMGDSVRSFAAFQFRKNHCLPEDQSFSDSLPGIAANIKNLKESYRPQRRLRRRGTERLPDEATRVQVTLLEYGDRGNAAGAFQSPADNEASEESAAEAADTRKVEEKLLQTMTEAEEHEGRLTASAVGILVGLQASEIQQAAEEYAEKQLAGERQADLSSGLQKQRDLLQGKTGELEEQKVQLEARVAALRRNLVELREKEEDVDSKLRVLEEEVKGGGGGKEAMQNLQTLKGLVILNEHLKSQESDFREQCREELTNFRGLCESLEESGSEDSSGVGGGEGWEAESEALRQRHAAALQQLGRLRQLVARRSRAIASLQRQIDEVPTRAELSQYQRRFVELYGQVAAKHKETKQFFTLYNTLDDIRMYLRKELSLLNSVLDSFGNAMATSAGREQFLQQFESAVEGVKANKAKVEKRRQEERIRRDRLSDSHLGLVDQQRIYFRTVKELTEECRRNEALLTRLQQLQQQS